ncbi:uncharacterized protein A1O9_07742 [Exophiala aquamarina CBS 119918]|uniref:Uncharacterized protein n=1 Tax=Exophiala aquamarina CBS 119918 TaxID=1182545 RepID=A0A072P8G0_9EURO|nr:uncharacterized protein A1O9_07742 [Exophiala aquamarina CBS 119918]KEF56161.1 hypothetical protein A1O9_07742 [Exophiala aquamarina CBS 119918]
MTLSGACTALSSISIFILMARHATHYSKPNEQSKILRICSLIPIYSILSLVTIAAPNSFVYLTPWLEFFEAWALGSFFLLLCEFVSPSTQFRDVFFAALEVPQRRRGKVQPQDGLEWFRKKWFAVFQYVIVAILIAIITAITQAANVYCLTSNKIHFAHIWCSIVVNISLVMAVLAVIQFYNALKRDLKHHKPLAKFLAFKLIILITFLQKIVFLILHSTNLLKESSKLTYADVNMGIETMLVCVEMVPFSIFFHYAYDVAAYDLTKCRPLPLSDIASGASSRSSVEEGNAGYELQSRLVQPIKQSNQREQSRFGNRSGAYYGGPLGIKAWAGLVDPREIIHAIQFSFVMRSEASKMNRDVVAMGLPPPSYYAGRR